MLTKRKHILYVCISVLLAFLLIVGCGSINKQAPGTGQTVKRIYINSAYGYEFTYPTSWQEIKGDQKKGFTGAIERKNLTAVAGVRVADISKGTDIEDLPGALDKMMAESMDHFKKIDQEFVEIDGLRALRYTYTFRSNNGERVKQMQQIAVSKRRAFYFVFHCSASEFGKIEPEINQIADTFRLKE